MTEDGLDLAALDRWVRSFAGLVRANKDLLTQLDSAIGDADHGINMDRGMTAVVAALDASPPTSVAALFKQVGMTLVSTVGGASGPLYGTFFLRVATASGVLFAKVLNLFLKSKINPIIGAAGVSAVPDSARVCQMVGAREDPNNFLIMHAMAPNVAGVIGSAVGAGILLATFG